MRIGFDMLAVQSPQHGPRGIGRYSANLVTSLLNRDDSHRYVLYVHEELPDERVPRSPRAEIRPFRPRRDRGESTASSIDRIARTNPDGLDALIVLSPFEVWSSYAPPAPPDNGLILAAVVYDLIPFLFQSETGDNPLMPRLYRALETLRRYDALLAISEATRADCLSMLKLPANRVVNIGAACDPRLLTPDRTSPAPDRVRDVLSGLGIDRSFVLNVGGLVDRKNTGGLLEAFARLPVHLRETHQLVLTFMINDWGRNVVQDHVRKLNIEDHVVLTGHVSDETLQILYQRCAAFAFPSHYEGFGLPLLEAMHSGAPIVAGNNSSQVEVVGDAGLLAQTDDVGDIASKIALLLDDPVHAKQLQARGVTRARQFSWERTTDLALSVLERLEVRPSPNRRLRFDGAHDRRKPTIAFFSPYPPRKSGISDYSALLIDELRETYRIDLFHDAGYVPQPVVAGGDFACADYRAFERLAAVKDYHAIVYQMGNSRYHNYMYPIMQNHRGLVTLHDLCLVGFHLTQRLLTGRGLRSIREDLLRWYPESREAIIDALEAWGDDYGAIERGCARNGWTMNRPVLDAAQLTVVHSPWCETQVQNNSPHYADRLVVVPFGTHPRRTNDSERVAIRERFGLPQDALIVASFGYVHPDKLGAHALDAFAAVARENAGALFLFVGEEVDGGAVRARTEQLGLRDRVRFLGRQQMESFDALMMVTDIGINLRRPPTNGETSAALMNLLASGVATVVTDVATFSDPPSNVVRKVRWDENGPAVLCSTVLELATDRVAREALGRSAWDYIQTFHDWSRVARRYVDAIERCHRELATDRGPRHQGRGVTAALTKGAGHGA